VRLIGVVVADPPTDAGLCLAAGLKGIEEHALIFQRSPQPFDEDVVHPAAAAIHRDADAGVLQRGGEGEAGGLRALIGVEDVQVGRIEQSPPPMPQRRTPRPLCSTAAKP